MAEDYVERLGMLKVKAERLAPESELYLHSITGEVSNRRTDRFGVHWNDEYAEGAFDVVADCLDRADSADAAWEHLQAAGLVQAAH